MPTPLTIRVLREIRDSDNPCDKNFTSPTHFLFLPIGRNSSIIHLYRAINRVQELASTERKYQKNEADSSIIRCTELIPFLLIILSLPVVRNETENGRPKLEVYATTKNTNWKFMLLQRTQTGSLCYYKEHKLEVYATTKNTNWKFMLLQRTQTGSLCYKKETFSIRNGITIPL